WCDMAVAEVEAAGADPAVAFVGEFTAVRELDVLRPDALPEVVARLAGDPAGRAALLEPARVTAAGRVVDVPSYTAWWLRHRLGGPFAVPGPFGPLLPAPPEWVTALDPEVRRALGVLGRVEDVDLEVAPAVLARLTDPAV